MKIWLAVLTTAVIGLFLLITYQSRQGLANFLYMSDRVLKKADVGYQRALKVVPDGSAYIPIIFKDKSTSNKYFKKSEKQWLDKDLEKEGYYAVEKLFMPYEHKR